ncbi:hypothetical protein CEB3_c36150 [Peptococcaceae bacterium CEB3]|nr:hypothetical protein CEB3_c36150 [Peptococcaceae bacterium CEB3]
MAPPLASCCESLHAARRGDSAPLFLFHPFIEYRLCLLRFRLASGHKNDSRNNEKNANQPC